MNLRLVEEIHELRFSELFNIDIHTVNIKILWRVLTDIDFRGFKCHLWCKAQVHCGIHLNALSAPLFKEITMSFLRWRNRQREFTIIMIAAVFKHAAFSADVSNE